MIGPSNGVPHLDSYGDFSLPICPIYFPNNRRASRVSPKSRGTFCSSTDFPGRYGADLSQFQRIVTMNHTKFPIWRQDLHSSRSAQFCFSFGRQNDCVTMLHTRFILPIDNYMIHRYNITKILWMINTISSRFRAVPAWSASGFREPTNLTIRIFGTR